MAEYALTFDGQNDYMYRANLAALGFLYSTAYSRTVTFWSKGTPATIIGNERTGANPGNGAIQFSSGKLRYSVNSYHGAPYVYSKSTTLEMPSNLETEWNFFAVTFSMPGNSGSGTRSYTIPLCFAVNNLYEATTLSFTNNRLYLTDYYNVDFFRSRNYTFGTSFYPGSIDEVGIWSRILTQAELLELYNKGLGRPINPAHTFYSTGNSVGLNLVGSWRVNDGSGTSVVDNSGNGRTLTTSGGPTWVSGFPFTLELLFNTDISIEDISEYNYKQLPHPCNISDVLFKEYIENEVTCTTSIRNRFCAVKDFISSKIKKSEYVAQKLSIIDSQSGD